MTKFINQIQKEQRLVLRIYGDKTSLYDDWIFVEEIEYPYIYCRRNPGNDLEVFNADGVSSDKRAYLQTKEQYFKEGL